jgi:hypothetical protein
MLALQFKGFGNCSEPSKFVKDMRRILASWGLYQIDVADAPHQGNM